MLKINHSINLNLKIITFPTIFNDHRGDYIEIFNKKLFNLSDISNEFVSDCFIYSKINVLRGIHGDSITWKLVSCIHGKFFIAIVNLDKDSENYLKFDTFILSEDKKKQILVPPLHGIGHCILSKEAIYYYKQTSYYEDKDEFVFPWNSEKLNIKWPINNPILSEKDTF
ncbi:dTDP-4-dehydrorhamnose 3,5-epimerase family protein [Pelagibacteraceae bacterium]|nr:dTDP-4-dehydrorhamnose 3,5-epimerase family protein [Pelagibacteraceae bacterium]